MVKGWFWENFSDEWEKLPMLAVLALQVPVPVRGFVWLGVLGPPGGCAVTMTVFLGRLVSGDSTDDRWWVCLFSLLLFFVDDSFRAGHSHAEQLHRSAGRGLAGASPDILSIFFSFLRVLWRFASSGLVGFPLLRFVPLVFFCGSGWSGWGFLLPLALLHLSL